jgi:murein DD-endopeptidase MepM/ murein hydrolase activator NlpD
MTPEGPRVVLAPAHAEPDLVDARPAVTAVPAAAPGTHRVVAGETLYRIARGLGITPGALAEMNGISVSAPLAVGQVLVVPAPGGKGAPESSPAGSSPGAAEEGEGGSALPPALAAAFETTGGGHAGSPAADSTAPRPVTGSSEESPERAAPVARRDGHAPGRIESSVLGALPPTAPARQVAVASAHRPSALHWPLRGVLYARFGKKGRSPHDGIDLAAPAGTPVRTAGEGSVLFAGPQQGYGLLVIIEHAHGVVTVYAHNRDLRVKTGQAVREGQVIATVGESGKTSGPHLHFEVRQDGAPVDPLDFLGPPPAS